MEPSSNKFNLELSPADSEPGTERRIAAKHRLATKYGIAAEFVRVPTLSKILSISANAIYAQMSNGAFPVAHKKVGSVVVVLFDDFVEWYCSEGVEPGARRQQKRFALPDTYCGRIAPADEPPLQVEARDDARLENKTERAQRIKFEALAAARPK